MEPEMKYHLEGLKPKQIKVLRQMGRPMQERGFYLGGGTTLAIYFGHRTSVDLDWFLPDRINDAFILAESLRGAGLDFVTTQTGPGTLHGTILGVRVTFLEFHYPLLQPVTQWKEMECSLASLDDLACMKLSAIAQRGQRKDFCDIYILGTKHRPLQDLLSLYQRKFKVKDISPVLYGLSYFDDADDEPMPRMLMNVQWRTIKKTIQEWVKELSRV
jgi:predicted nucleotidyltransferase component of viral defense system